MTFRKSIGRLIFTCAVFAALFAPSLAEAQQASFWLPKFVCGYQVGDIRLLSDGSPLNDPTGYERFKPGNYATTINVTNFALGNRDIFAVAIVTLPFPVPFVGPVITTAISVPVLINQRLITGIPGLFAPGATGSLEVNCQDIASAVAASGIPVTGAILEGRLFLINTLGDNTLDVVSVVTYANKDRFAEHLISALPNEPGIGGGGEPPKPGGAAEQFGVSGAGGLGVGGSIDVEHYDAITISLGGGGGGGGTALGTLLEGLDMDAIVAREE